MGCKGDRCSAPGAGWSSRHDKRILDASHGAEVPVFNVCLAAFWSYSGPIPPFCVSISPFWNEDVSSCSVIAHWKTKWDPAQGEVPRVDSITEDMECSQKGT